MALIAYLPAGFAHMHESHMFDALVDALRASCASLPGSQYIVGNVMFEGEEVDAIFIKRDAVSVIEMKAYGGVIHFSENGDWFADEKLVRGGRRGNPFRQVRANKFALLNYLRRRENEFLKMPRDIGWGQISGVVLFGQDIRFEERLPGNVGRWFHICDQRSVATRLASLHSPGIELTDDETAGIIGGLEFSEQQLYGGETAKAGPFETEAKNTPAGRLRIVYHRESAFRESQNRMRESAGTRSQGAVKTIALLDELRKGINRLDEFKQRNDARIPNSTIYKINDNCELVTIQSVGALYPFFLGSPLEVDQWIAANDGLTLTVDGTTQRIIPTIVGDDSSAERLQPPSTTTENIPFLSRVTELDLETLVPSALIRRHLTSLNETSTEEEILDALEAVSVEETRNFLFDVTSLLRAGDIQSAQARIRLRTGDACPVVDAAGFAAAAASSDANADQILVLDDLGENDLQRLLDPRSFQDWMLFLHPDQKKAAEADFDRPVVLTGVSGSGKTCILIHRARYLARKYPGERIGILTLNRSLANLLNNLVRSLCTDTEAKHIHARAFYDYFRDLLHLIGPKDYVDQLLRITPDGSHLQRVLQGLNPQNLANEVDFISGETLEDTWKDFYESQNPELKSWFEEVDKYLYPLRIDNSRYLTEEFTLIRSALMPVEREETYLLGDGFRAGRCIPFPANIRSDILKLLLFYEEHMLAGAMLDVLELTQALMPAWKKIRNLPENERFRCLLIDEFQDLSTLDLRLLQFVPTSRENGLFLAGDTVQKILVKRLRLSDATLDKGSAKYIQIKKNYRNSRQILKAASVLANEYGKRAGAQGEDIEVLDPELAARETNPPVALKTDHQITKAWEIAHECVQHGAKAWTICIATAAPQKAQVTDILKAVPADLLAEELTGDHIKNPETLVVCSINELKGFEFNCVIVIGCNQGDFPAEGVPAEESWRDALRLYVSMTRARDQVFLLYDSKPSEFLQTMEKDLAWKEQQAQGYLKLRQIRETTPSSGRLTSRARHRIKDLCHVDDDNSAWDWFTQPELDLLKKYFARFVFRKQVPETTTFREWLTPRNLRQIQLTRLTRHDDVKEKEVSTLTDKLRAHRVGIERGIKRGSNFSPDEAQRARERTRRTTPGHCRACGAWAIPGEDHCYHCKAE